MTGSRTEGKYGFIGRIRRPVAYGFTSSYVSIFASLGRTFGFFVRDNRTGGLMLPVQVGGAFGLAAENSMPIMAAFPARLGAADGRWLNVYPACETIDLSEVPNDCMLEARPDANVTFDSLRAAGGVRIPAEIVSEGILFKDTVYRRIEVAYRFPSDPDDIPGRGPGLRPKGGDSDGGQRGYGPAHTFGVIHFVTRTKIAHLLAKGGIELDPANDRDWSVAKLSDLGLPAETIELGGPITE